MMFTKTTLSSSIALALAVSGTATAQQANESALEEVIVTATKRAQSIQDVPYNISAISGDSLVRAGVTDMARLARSIPGVAFMDKGPKSAGAFANSIAMRGLNIDTAGNTSDRPGLTAPTVATYIDNTPVFTALRLKDIERVEVLRGPQGTLYGSGAMGGIIHLIQKKPNVDETELELTTRLSSTNGSGGINSELDAMFNLPIGERAAIRGNVGRVDNAGFIDSPMLFQVDSSGVPILADPSDPVGSVAAGTSEKDVNDEEIINGRLSVLVDVTDDISASLSYHFQRDEIGGSRAITPVLGEYKNANLQEQPFDRDVDLIALDVEADLGFATMTVSIGSSEVSGTLIKDSSYIYSGQLADSLNFPGFFGSGLDLYTEYYGNNPRFLMRSDRTWTDEVDTAEIRFSSNGNGAVDWLIGFTYMNQEADFRQEDSALGRNDYIDAVNAAGATLVGQDGTLASGPGFFTPKVDNDLTYFFDNRTEFQDLALFGELTWHLNDDWQITGGARYFDQEFKAEQVGGIVAGDFIGTAKLAADDQDTLFKLNTSYDISDDAMVFFTWAQGYRRGGVNAIPEGLLRPDLGEEIFYAPDEIESVEIGIKGTFTNNWDYTATLFAVDWSDAQVNTLMTALVLPGVINVPESETRGVEFQLTGYFTESILFNLGYSYVDTEVTKSITAADTLALVGSKLPVPEHTASASLNYFQSLNSDAELVWSLNASYRSDTPSATEATTGFNALQFAVYDGFALVDASVAYNKGNWGVTGFVENITNERGTLGGNVAQTDAPFGLVDSVVRPRTFGINLSYRYSN